MFLQPAQLKCFSSETQLHSRKKAKKSHHIIVWRALVRVLDDSDRGDGPIVRQAAVKALQVHQVQHRRPADVKVVALVIDIAVDQHIGIGAGLMS